MHLRCLLVPIGPGLDATRRLDAALRLGRRLHAHIGVAFVAPGPEHVLASLGSLAHVDGTTLEAIRQDVREAAAEGKAALEAWCGREGVPLVAGSDRLDATFATWTEFSGEVEPLLTLTGRVNDLVIVDRPDPARSFTGRALDTALFAIGRPTLMVGEAVPHDLLDHVVVAWNGSLEATRLIGQSIALLHDAARVTVVHARTERFEEARGRSVRLSALARDRRGGRHPSGRGWNLGRRGHPGRGGASERLHAGAGRVHPQPRARAPARRSDPPRDRTRAHPGAHGALSAGRDRLLDASTVTAPRRMPGSPMVGSISVSPPGTGRQGRR